MTTTTSMKIAITGGTGFIGRHLARRLLAAGHEVTLLARGVDRRDTDLVRLPGVRLVQGSVGDPAALAKAFAGCDGVAHCAGINREIGDQTYERVHVRGTASVVAAATAAGARRLAFLSFLRARPGRGSPYHESKWQAEELVRASGLDYTVLKCGVIYGRGDHMLDHLSHALHTFPVFALVGRRPRPVAPVAVEEVARVLEASLIEGRLARRTVAVLGPEVLTLDEAVRRVAALVGRNPLYFPLPVAAHRLLARVCERTMAVPMLSLAQARILAEGVTEPGPLAGPLPEDLRPRLPFHGPHVARGLPAPGPFGRADLRCSWCRPVQPTGG
jgi:NADH dehydrogenase